MNSPNSECIYEKSGGFIMCSVHLGRRGLAIGLLAVSMLVVACAAKQPHQPTSPASAAIIGAADAPVTMVEYGDYL